MSSPTATAAAILQVRNAYLATNLSLLSGWSIVASCGNPGCQPGEPLPVGLLLRQRGDRPLKAVTIRLRCRTCQSPAVHVCLHQPDFGGRIIEHVVLAPMPPGRND